MKSINLINTCIIVNKTLPQEYRVESIGVFYASAVDKNVEYIIIL